MKEYKNAKLKFYVTMGTIDFIKELREFIRENNIGKISNDSEWIEIIANSRKHRELIQNIIDKMYRDTEASKKKNKYK